ncbi:hypothetical protein Leryth_021236 [Lithospermum erythrorhizon]|nr:hypothetical protein Leryth_021236 [Lithospermum erythrorhizon]
MASPSFTLPASKPTTLTPPPPPPSIFPPHHTRSLAFRSDPSLPRFKLHASLKETSNNAVVSKAKSEDSELPKSAPVVADEASVNAFMSQVADLVKLVDSRDIVELELKQLDCEVVIRKKEALQQQNVVTIQPQQQYQPQPQMNYAPPSPPPPAASSGPPAVAPKAEPSKPKSSHPPMKCPMAGTFYRAPAPGAPPFVKVGDKVQKGQVVCIIEAMKLMNEIEAEKSGTILEIVAEDGKPVSVDTPLFIIA